MLETSNSLHEAAHKVWLLYKLTKHFGFYCARVRPIDPNYWSISFAKENYAKTGWAPLTKIGYDGKRHRFLTGDKSIAKLYARSSAFPNAKCAIGLVSFIPCINNKEQLLGKAALFDALTSFSCGFGWKKERYGEKTGEIEELLATFDLQFDSQDADLENGMVELVNLHECLHRVNDLISEVDKHLALIADVDRH